MMMKINQDYLPTYYQEQQHGSKQSAREVIPLILHYVQPQSVVDIGCGVGTWLSVFAENGITDITGIDGEYIEPAMLHIPPEKFLHLDLETPIVLPRKFDLVVSLEVAEHLSSGAAEQFIESLVNLGDIVLFSAAIPFQGGPHHVNEQWPEYWQTIFQRHDYVAVDALRHQIWQNEKVEVWYRQNILFYVKQTVLTQHPLLNQAYHNTHLNQLALVHPKIYLRGKE